MSTWFRLLTGDRVLTDRIWHRRLWWYMECVHMYMFTAVVCMDSGYVLMVGVCVCLKCEFRYVCMYVHMCVRVCCCAFFTRWMCEWVYRYEIFTFRNALFIFTNECVLRQSRIYYALFSPLSLSIERMHNNHFSTSNLNLYNNGMYSVFYLFVYTGTWYKQTAWVFWQTIEMAQQTTKWKTLKK